MYNGQPERAHWSLVDVYVGVVMYATDAVRRKGRDLDC